MPSMKKNDREMLHSKIVGKLCEAITLKLKVEQASVHRIKTAGFMRDIAGIFVEKVLGKTWESWC